MKHCCWNVFNIADLFCHFCHLASSFNGTARLHTRQSWLKTGFLFTTNCNEFIGKDEWPLNSSDLNPLDYHVWGAVLERYKSLQPKPENIDELEKVLQLSIWLCWSSVLAAGPISTGRRYWISCHKTRSTKPYWAFRRLQACVKAGDGHFEHTLKWTIRLSDFGICNNIQCILTMKITTCCWLLRAENMA